jgi:DNA-binding beta-propeller fold protein YncE
MSVSVTSNGNMIEPNYVTAGRNGLRDPNRSRLLLLTLCSVLIALCSVLFVPDRLDAEPQGPHVAYVDSITEDEEGGKIFFPSTVFVEPVRNEIYVIDGRARIIIYTSDFFPLFTLSKRDGIETPHGLAVDIEGNLYVAQSATKENLRHRISVFNACFKWKRDIYLEGFEGSNSFVAERLAVDRKGNIYIIGSGPYLPGLIILNDQGQLLEIISPEEEGKKVRLTNVTLDKMGRIYLVSEEEGHIYVYTEDRKFLFKFGEKGGSTGKLSRPIAIGVDNRNGRMFVLDYMRHTVSAYDNEGKYIFEFGGLGWGEGWFQHPRDISVDSIGRILVADTFNDRIEVLQPTEQLEQPKVPPQEIKEKASEGKPKEEISKEEITEQQPAIIQKEADK